MPKAVSLFSLFHRKYLSYIVSRGTMWLLKRNEQKQMNNFKVNKAETTYNNGDTWEVVDVRNNEVVRTCTKGGDAAAFVIHYENELVKSEKQWAEWEA